MSSLNDLEAQRLQLEESVAALRKSLHHWRTWDAEYEGLKEELERSDDPQNEGDCSRISDELGGELVNNKEIRELFGVGNGRLRPSSQVAGLIDRRQDYVQQNINSISKQLRSVEDRLEHITLEQDREDDSGGATLPLTEITEELDDDGNVIASNVSQPESATAQIIHTLRKAGLTDLDDKPHKELSNASTTPNEVPEQKTSQASQINTTETTDPAVTEQSSSSATKKSVKFADHHEEFQIPSTQPNDHNETTTPKPDSSMLSASFGKGERVIELDDDDEVVGATPFIPDDESPEDARLRREMLQYNLNEIGSVVAELDLDEDFSDDDDNDDIDLDEELDDSEISEDEDEHGRSLRKGVSKSYRQQMLELEERLMARMIENVGPEPDETSPFIDPEELRKLVIQKDEQMPSAKGKEAAAKKGVRFADDLDVSEAPKEKQAKQAPAPMADSVLERTPGATSSVSLEDKKPARVSRFKQAKGAQDSPPEPAMADENRPILSNSVVERPAASSSTTVPTPADELDPEIQQRQLASEYYRMRNNMVRQQGGFKVTDEDRETPLMENRDGKVKKVSRFKAARLK